MYRKYQEVHYQKAYTLEKIKTLLEKAGLSYLWQLMMHIRRNAPLYDKREDLCCSTENVRRW